MPSGRTTRSSTKKADLFKDCNVNAAREFSTEALVLVLLLAPTTRGYKWEERFYTPPPPGNKF